MKDQPEKTPAQLHAEQVAMRHKEDGPFFERVEMPGCAPPVMASEEHPLNAFSLEEKNEITKNTDYYDAKSHWRVIAYALSTKLSFANARNEELRALLREAKGALSLFSHLATSEDTYVQVWRGDCRTARALAARIEKELSDVQG